MIGSWRAFILLTIAGAAACGPAADRKEANMRISSAAFADGGAIPPRYSCDGAGVSPPLAWSGAPPATRSFALIVDDPDAPGGLFRHWAMFDIPATAADLQEDAGTRPPAGARQARNDFGKPGYGGPCPPRGHGPHRYRFRLLALDVPQLAAGGSRNVSDIEQAATPHVLASATLRGVYRRS